MKPMIKAQRNANIPACLPRYAGHWAEIDHCSYQEIRM